MPVILSIFVKKGPMPKIHRFLITVLACMSMLGCKEKERPTFYVDPEILSYCLFPEGSYWVYQNESLQTLTDSAYLTNRRHSIIDSEEEGIQADTYSYDLRFLGKSREVVITAAPGDSELESTVTLVSEFYSSSASQEYDYLLRSDSRNLDTVSVFPITYITTRLDSIQISGKTYHDVIEFETSPSGASDFTSKVTWAKGIGIVRRTLVNGEVWNVVRYRIN